MKDKKKMPGQQEGNEVLFKAVSWEMGFQAKRRSS